MSRPSSRSPRLLSGLWLALAATTLLTETATAINTCYETHDEIVILLNMLFPGNGGPECKVDCTGSLRCKKSAAFSGDKHIEIEYDAKKEDCYLVPSDMRINVTTSNNTDTIEKVEGIGFDDGDYYEGTNYISQNFASSGIAFLRGECFQDMPLFMEVILELGEELAPSNSPTSVPILGTRSPTIRPTNRPTRRPCTESPSEAPSLSPSVSPSDSLRPSETPSLPPSGSPSLRPSETPSLPPSVSPSDSLRPSEAPSLSPSGSPSLRPSEAPSLPPSSSPSLRPSEAPSLPPTTTPDDCNGLPFELEVLLDGTSGSEFGWKLTNQNVGTSGWESTPNIVNLPDQRLLYSVCLPSNECWDLEISGGGQLGEDGYYKVSLASQEIYKGESFASAVVNHDICIGQSTYCKDIERDFRYKRFRRKKTKKVGKATKRSRNGKTNCDDLGNRRKTKIRAQNQICMSQLGRQGTGDKVFQKCLVTCGLVGKGDCSFLKMYGSEGTETVAPGNMIKIDPYNY